MRSFNQNSQRIQQEKRVNIQNPKYLSMYSYSCINSFLSNIFIYIALLGFAEVNYTSVLVGMQEFLPLPSNAVLNVVHKPHEHIKAKFKKST